MISSQSAHFISASNPIGCLGVMSQFEIECRYFCWPRLLESHHAAMDLSDVPALSRRREDLGRCPSCPARPTKARREFCNGTLGFFRKTICEGLTARRISSRRSSRNTRRGLDRDRQK